MNKMLKSTFSGLQRCRLAVVASQVCEISREFEFIAGQIIESYRPWCQLKAHMRLPVSHYSNYFGRIYYRFRDIDV